jgi:hypothetical protein
MPENADVFNEIPLVVESDYIAPKSRNRYSEYDKLAQEDDADFLKALDDYDFTGAHPARRKAQIELVVDKMCDVLDSYVPSPADHVAHVAIPVKKPKAKMHIDPATNSGHNMGAMYVLDSLAASEAKVVVGKQWVKNRAKKSPKRESEGFDMAAEDKKQNERDILASLVAQEVPGRTHLVAIVVDNGDPVKGESPRNIRQPVRCNHGMAFSEGYPYDQASDSYMIICVHQIQLGNVSASYQLSMPGVGEWHLRVPLPEVVINRYLSGVQKAKIADLQSKFPAPRHTIQIVQMTGCEQ